MDVRSSPHILPDVVEWSDGYTCEIWVDDYTRKFPNPLSKGNEGAKNEVLAPHFSLKHISPYYILDKLTETRRMSYRT